jgi:hypothetical protein
VAIVEGGWICRTHILKESLKNHVINFDSKWLCNFIGIYHLRFTTSDETFGILDLRLLMKPLASSNFSFSTFCFHALILHSSWFNLDTGSMTKLVNNNITVKSLKMCAFWWLSQTRTCISNIYCRGLVYVQRFEVRGECCSFCWY